MRYGVNMTTSDVSSDPQDSDEDAGGWIKNILQRAPVDFDSMPIVPKQPFSVEDGPVEFFSRYFEHDVFQFMIQQTNLYAEQNKAKRWNDVTLAEMSSSELTCSILQRTWIIHVDTVSMKL